MKRLALLLFTACSLTPIPDVTSNYSPPCDTSQRICEHEFKLMLSGQNNVQLRGDFAPGAWDNGIQMTKADLPGFWTASISVPWGSNVQYKFFVNGTTWETDPENPKTIVNGGNTNSLLEDVTCVAWTCTGQ